MFYDPLIQRPADEAAEDYAERRFAELRKVRDAAIDFGKLLADLEGGDGDPIGGSDADWACITDARLAEIVEDEIANGAAS